MTSQKYFLAEISTVNIFHITQYFWVKSYNLQTLSMEPTEHFVIYFEYIRRLFPRSASPFKAAVHWPRSLPNLTWAAIWLRADSAQTRRVSGSASTDSRHVQFGDDCAKEWTAAFRLVGFCVGVAVCCSKSRQPPLGAASVCMYLTAAPPPVRGFPAAVGSGEFLCGRSATGHAGTPLCRPGAHHPTNRRRRRPYRAQVS